MRYLAAFDTNAGFRLELCTHGYSQDKGRGLKVVATRDWVEGEQIPGLTGVLADMRAEVESNLIVKRVNNFSVMWSEMKGLNQLWLGPARFVNHECDANCGIASRGKWLAGVDVTRDIKAGEEITVYYDDSYFEEGNINCECSSCKKVKLKY